MANTTNFGWETPDDTDLVKDGALAMRTLGNAIDTSLVDLKGGTTGQVLSKNTNSDMDFTWVTTNDADAIQNSIVDAKGDLIAASANDTPARLAVGNNGETLVADSSQTTGLRYNPPVGSLANPVINGGMDIWQRGTSFTNGDGGGIFAADRWQIYSNTSGRTWSRQNVSDSTNLPNIQYALRAARNSGNTATQSINVLTSLETTNSIPFAGKTITLSFYARKGANYSSSSDALSALLYTGTGTDQSVFSGFTGSVTLINQTATLTTTWQRFAYTATVSSSATQIGLSFAYSPTGTAGANDWFEITGVQVDVGTWTASTAPTFRRSGATLAGELQAAQRYYWRSADASTYGGHGVGVCFATTGLDALIVFPTQMRTAPSSVEYANLVVNDADSNEAVTALTIAQKTSRAANINATVAAGLTQYRTGLLLNNNNTAGYIGFSAEL